MSNNIFFVLILYQFRKISPTRCFFFFKNSLVPVINELNRDNKRDRSDILFIENSEISLGRLFLPSYQVANDARYIWKEFSPSVVLLNQSYGVNFVRTFAGIALSNLSLSVVYTYILPQASETYFQGFLKLIDVMIITEIKLKIEKKSILFNTSLLLKWSMTKLPTTMYGRRWKSPHNKFRRRTQTTPDYKKQITIETSNVLDRNRKKWRNSKNYLSTWPIDEGCPMP